CPRSVSSPQSRFCSISSLYAVTWGTEHEAPASPLFLWEWFRFQSLKPICVYNDPCLLLIDMRPDFLPECAHQRLVLVRTIWISCEWQIAGEIGKFPAVSSESQAYKIVEALLR